MRNSRRVSSARLRISKNCAVAAEAASTATLNITDPRALIGKRLVDVLEENDAYRIRCGDMLIGVLLMKRGYEVRLGKMTITYLDKEYYHGIGSELIIHRYTFTDLLTCAKKHLTTSSDGGSS